MPENAVRPADWAVLPMFDLIGTPVWIFDVDQGRIHWANKPALGIWQADSLAELCAREMGSDMSTSVRERLKQYQADFVLNPGNFTEQWTLYPHGKPVSLYVNYRGYVLPDGRMAILCEARPKENSSPESMRSVEALLHTPMMISLYAIDGAPLYRNPAARASVRCPMDTLAMRFVEKNVWPEIQDRLRSEDQVNLTVQVNISSGTCWHEVSVRQKRDAVSGGHALLVSEMNVSSLKKSEARALYLSQHDILTGLPNRGLAQRHFMSLVENAGAAVGLPPDQQAAVLLIDLDGFKYINDTWGHAAGDELLIQVARRLEGAMSDGHLVARFGGDEFLAIIHGDDVHGKIGHVHEQIKAALGQPFYVGMGKSFVSASIGVSLYPDHGEDFATLLQHADLAMYQSKDNGRDALSFYQNGLSESLREQSLLEEELRHALEHAQFELHYQPRIGSGTGIGRGGIVGAEALVRWRHPERGLVPPGLFIQLCEKAGLIRELGSQVFLMAARQQAAWCRAGHDIKLSVNLSPREFTDDGLLADLEGTLHRTGCRPQSLEIEVTESMLIDASDRPLQVLIGLKRLGLSIALDDFGTGYSNLAYLQRFPFDTLKIDRSFVQAKDAEHPLTEAIVGLCRAMHLHPVAEGIETEAQYRWLQRLGVEEFQGYHFAPPLAADAFEHLLCVQRDGGKTLRSA